LYIIDLKECGFNLDEIKLIINLNDKTKIKHIFDKKEIELLNQREKINLSIEKLKNINFLNER
jgi:DNA-binding transcriptional MerR regulator